MIALMEAGLGVGLLLCVAAIWRAIVFPPEPTSTPIRFVDQRVLRPASTRSLPPPPNDTVGIVRIGFAGDVMQHRLQAKDDFSASYAELAPELRRFDLAEANLEFPVDTTVPIGPEPGSATFNGSPRHISALAAAGFDLIQTANNHAYDQGPLGVVHTLDILRERGLEPVGTAPTKAELEERPIVVREVHGVRIGFVSYSITPNRYPAPNGERLWPPRDMPLFSLNFAEWDGEYRAAGLDLFREHVRLARSQKIDLLVALVHWGAEWRRDPTEAQQRAGHDLIDAGLDLVVGTHSHVLNPPELYRGHLIAYSLGDLIADFHPLETRTGAILDVTFVKSHAGETRLTAFSFHPTLVERPNHRIHPLREVETGERRRAWDLARTRLGDGVTAIDVGN